MSVPSTDALTTGNFFRASIDAFTKNDMKPELHAMFLLEAILVPRAQFLDSSQIDLIKRSQKRLCRLGFNESLRNPLAQSSHGHPLLRTSAGDAWAGRGARCPRSGSRPTLRSRRRGRRCRATAIGLLTQEAHNIRLRQPPVLARARNGAWIEFVLFDEPANRRAQLARVFTFRVAVLRGACRRCSLGSTSAGRGLRRRCTRTSLVDYCQHLPRWSRSCRSESGSP